jgi:Protein of unknown function (DUF1569)
MEPQIVKSKEIIKRNVQFKSFDEVMIELTQLQQADLISISADWDLAHTLDHCARSIEYAVKGFPKLRNPIFRNLIGKTAFHVFDWNGKMKHALNEEILGDSELPNYQLNTALQRLESSIVLFQDWQGHLQPHFTYGSLNKDQYEKANAMHIADHFSVIAY